MSLLNGSFPLAKKFERQKDRRGRETSLIGLAQLVEYEYVGPAARTALRCVEERDADPRLKLLILEQGGYFAPCQ